MSPRHGGGASKVKPYAKAVVAGLTAFFGSLATAMPNGISAGEMVGIAGATVVAAATVYLVPNGKKAQELEL